VLAVTASDLRGTSWPLDAVVRRPVLRVELSDAPWQADDPPVWLFAGPPDQGLRDDLATSPLRVATRARIVPSTIEPFENGWTIAPTERLAPGARLTVAVAAWLRGASTGLRMGAPFLAEMRVSDAPEAGAQAVASWPADGAGGVPIALPAVVVRFDGPVEGIADGLSLRDAGGRGVPAEARSADCREEGWPHGFCAVLVPRASLDPDREHVVVVSEAVRDATGAPVGPWSARFRTGLDAEEAPPELLALPCALDEQSLDGLCVRSDDGSLVVRLEASEPVRASLAVAGQTLLSVAPRGSAVLAIQGLPPATTFAAVLRLRDLGGTVLERPLTLATTEPLPAVSITEVRSDPNGPEPRQEYVEVLNYGPVTLELAGLSLSDHPASAGDVVARPARLAPGQRALLVPDDFDPDDPADVPVPPGVLLVPMGRSLGSAGLSNAGEPLFLRDPSMRRLSAVPAVSTGAGACLARVGVDPRGDAAELFAVRECTPGAAP
jgi:hypothetical protein